MRDGIRPVGGCAVGAIFLVFTVGLARTYEGATQPNAGLTMDQAMTTGELKETGVAGLSPTQRTALDRWLNRWMAVVMNVSCGGTYKNTEEKLSIRENAGGVVLILEDGSVWMVEPVDRVDSALWLVTEDVIVIEASKGLEVTATRSSMRTRKRRCWGDTLDRSNRPFAKRGG